MMCDVMDLILMTMGRKNEEVSCSWNHYESLACDVSVATSHNERYGKNYQHYQRNETLPRKSDHS